MRKAHGFTLIELLVVIAIIAILAAILFPVFARARAKAQQNNCLSNIKQLALGTLMYVSDYDDRFAFAWSTVAFNGQQEIPGKLHWTWSIYPYVKNTQLYGCPGSNTDPYYCATCAWGGPMIYGDYAENGCLGARGGCGGCGCPGYNGGPWPLNLSTIYRPAELIMIKATDGPGWMYTCTPPGAVSMGYYKGGDPWDWASYTQSWQWPNIETRHNNGGNVAYCDGHAKWMAREKLYSVNPADFPMWNNTP